MTRDKSNHSVLITVSLTLLISIAVPTSVCSRASTANSWLSPLALKPPPLLLSPALQWPPRHLLSSSCQASPVSSSITTLFSVWSSTSVHQPCTLCCQASPLTTLSIKSAACCTAFSSERASPLKPTSHTGTTPPDRTLVPLYTSLQN